MTYWIKIGLGVLLLWAVAAIGIHYARKAQPTADSVAAYLEKEDVAAQSGSRRARTIERTENMMNQLSYEERQKLQRSGATRALFRKLTPEEQLAFLDATLPAGFRQMMESFNKMEPERRRQIVERTIAQMKQREGDAPPPGTDEKVTQRIIDQGLRSFYNDSSAEVKLDMAPLIEQMQKNMQSGRR